MNDNKEIHAAADAGARILFALRATQLASRMKVKLTNIPGVEVAPCHAAFTLVAP